MKLLSIVFLTFICSFSMANTTQSLVCTGTVKQDFDTRYFTITKDQTGRVIAQYSKETDSGEVVLLATYFDIKVKKSGLNEFEYSGSLDGTKKSFWLRGYAVNQSFQGQLEVNDGTKTESIDVNCSRN